MSTHHERQEAIQRTIDARDAVRARDAVAVERLIRETQLRPKHPLPCGPDWRDVLRQDLAVQWNHEHTSLSAGPRRFYSTVRNGRLHCPCGQPATVKMFGVWTCEWHRRITTDAPAAAAPPTTTTMGGRGEG